MRWGARLWLRIDRMGPVTLREEGGGGGDGGVAREGEVEVLLTNSVAVNDLLSFGLRGRHGFW